MSVSRRVFAKFLTGGAVASVGAVSADAAQGKTYIGAPGRPGQHIIYVEVYPVGKEMICRENGDLVDGMGVMCVDWIDDADIKKRETWDITAEVIAAAMYRHFTRI